MFDSIEWPDLPRLFKRIYRAESDRSGNIEGSGLKLAIAYKIVHLHRGTICVTSQPDQITTFTVELPFDNCKFNSKKILN